jgi:uncharacterized protein YjbI with pentapeptide repeats
MVAMIDAELNAQIDEHTAWSVSLGRVGRQLFAEDLDFRGIDLAGRILAEAVIPGANFSGMSLRDIDFAGCNLASADFSGCDLTGACFVKANLDYANLENADLTNASLRRASLVEAVLTGARLEGTDLRGAYFGKAAPVIDTRALRRNPTSPAHHRR